MLLTVTASVCVYDCVCVCVYECVCTDICVCVHECVCMSVCGVCACVFVYVYVCISECVCMYVCVYECVCVCVYATEASKNLRTKWCLKMLYSIKEMNSMADVLIAHSVDIPTLCRTLLKCVNDDINKWESV